MSMTVTASVVKRYTAVVMRIVTLTLIIGTNGCVVLPDRDVVNTATAFSEIDQQPG